MTANLEEPFFQLIYHPQSSKDISEDALRLAIGFLDTDKLMDVAPYKAFVALVSMTKGAIQNERKFQMPAKLMMAEMGMEHNNYDRLKESIKYLMSTVVDFNINKQDKNPGWNMAQILGPSRLENGIVHFEFTDPVWQKLKDPIVYAYITRKGVYSFTSKYDIALYNWFSRMMVPNHKQLVCEESIGRLLTDILHVDAKQCKTYSSYMRLNDKILSKSIKKINERTNFIITYEGIREGRKVARIRFVIQAKEKPQRQLKQELPADLKKLVQKLIEAGLNLDAKLETRLIELFDTLGSKGCHDRVKSILAEFKPKRDKLKSPGGYLRTKLFQEPVFEPEAQDDGLETKLVKEYQAVLLKVAANHGTTLSHQQFASYLDEHHEVLLPKILELAQQQAALKMMLRKIDPADKAALLASRGLIALLYSEHKDLGYVEKPLSPTEILNDDLQTVLKLAREQVNQNLQLRSRITQVGLKVEEIEALAVDAISQIV